MLCVLGGRKSFECRACSLEIIFDVGNIAYVVPRVLPLNISGCGMGLFKSHDTSIFAMKMH